MTDDPKALILLVDDEKTIRTLLSRALTSRGHAVVTGENVAGGCEHIEGREFDLLLIDKNLPDGSGLTIIERARELGHRSEAIVITGYSDTESAIKAVELGVFRYVRKPFDLDALQLDITNALETGKLRSDLAHRTRDLEATNQELWDALRRVFESERRTRQAERLANIGYLAAGVAHEINNPMSLLSMTIPFVSHELEKLGAGLENENVEKDAVQDAISQITSSIKSTEEAVDLLMRLSSDLHSLGRTEKRDPAPVKIAEVTGSAMRLVRHQLKYKAQTSVEVDEEITVNGHASRLVQVFINLLTNAGRAIVDGAAEENSVSISAAVEGDDVAVKVSDTGSGISDEHLEEIFKPFFTHSLKGDDQGTGIGLVLVKEIVDEHKGTVEVASARGEGTTFTIRLPLMQQTRASMAMGMPAAGEMIRARRKILFFDGEEANLRAYEESFGSMHEVLLAGSPDKVLETVDEHLDTLDTLVCELPEDAEKRTVLLSYIESWPELQHRVVFVGDPGEPLDQAKANGFTVFERPVRPAILLGTIYKIPPRKPSRP